jgi:hypothetical protein
MDSENFAGEPLVLRRRPATFSTGEVVGCGPATFAANFMKELQVAVVERVWRMEAARRSRGGVTIFDELDAHLVPFEVRAAAAAKKKAAEEAAALAVKFATELKAAVMERTCRVVEREHARREREQVRHDAAQRAVEEEAALREAKRGKAARKAALQLFCEMKEMRRMEAAQNQRRAYEKRQKRVDAQRVDEKRRPDIDRRRRDPGDRIITPCISSQQQGQGRSRTNSDLHVAHCDGFAGITENHHTVWCNQQGGGRPIGRPSTAGASTPINMSVCPANPRPDRALSHPVRLHAWQNATAREHDHQACQHCSGGDTRGSCPDASSGACF